MSSTPELPVTLTAENNSLSIVFDNSEYAPQAGDVIGRVYAYGQYVAEDWYDLTAESFSSSGDTIGVEPSLNGFITATEDHHGTIVMSYTPDRYNVTIEDVEIY